MEARVAVIIWRLGSNSIIEYHIIAALFGLGCSTVVEIMIDICQVIAAKLVPKYIIIDIEHY